MKRFFALLSTLILAIGLCACGNEELHSNEATGNTLSIEEEKYVGTWTSEPDDKDRVMSIWFMSNGKALFGEHQRITSLLHDGHCRSGEWFIDNGTIILTYYGETGSLAYVFDIYRDTIKGCATSYHIVDYHKIS